MGLFNKNQNMFMYLFIGIFTLVGTVFVILAVILTISEAGYFKSAVPVDTEVIRVGESSAVVAYQVNGRQYEARLNYSSSSLYEGKKLVCYYQPDTPGRVKSKNWLIQIIMGSMGLVFLIIGIVFLLCNVMKRKSVSTVKENGRRIYASITGVEMNTAYSINNRHPYNITCQYMDGNTIHIFKSDNLWFNPEGLMQGQEIPVYVDADNFGKYWVDTESVLPYRVEHH